MKNAPISQQTSDQPLREFSSFQRWTSRFLILTITALTLQPLTVAAQSKNGTLSQNPTVKNLLRQKDTTNQNTTPPSNPLAALENLLKPIVPEAWPELTPSSQKPTNPPNPSTPSNTLRPIPTDTDRAVAAQTILGLTDALKQTAQDTLAELTQTGETLRSSSFPTDIQAELLNRQQTTIQTYQTRLQELNRHLTAIDTAAGGQQNLLSRTLGQTPTAQDPAGLKTALTNLAHFLAQHPNQKPHTPVDPNHLPWGSAKPTDKEPPTTPAGFTDGVLEDTASNKAALDKTSSNKTPPDQTPEKVSEKNISLKETPVLPTAADLAETEDIQITADIKAKAIELGKNPVQIHQWLKNTIEYIPSYGSIQGSDLTYQTKRGNATDIASLEIALLRAAGIPARYVRGTIELPITKAQNWVGGVTTPQAAQSLLAQGGIPNIGLTSGGKIQTIRLEHTWVEAWVQYFPSRGAKHVGGVTQGDTWVPLDASYKQYTYQSGMDLKTKVPLDIKTLLDDAKTGATINDTEGWVQNLNASKLQTALTDYQTKIKTYIDTTKKDATVGDVLGSKTIIPEKLPYLAGSLQYKTVAIGAKYSSWPTNLRWQYRTTLTDAFGSELASLSQSTPKLAGKKITLSFIPASPADLALINRYLPKPHADGSPIDPSELPKSLPGYLLNLKAELRVDGQVVSSSSSAVTMGSALTQETAIFNPSSATWEEGEPNKPIAGEYHAIALDLQGVGQQQLAALKTRLEATKAKLELFQKTPTDPTPIKDLTKEDLSGDLLYSGILSYFASVDSSDQLTARTSGNIVSYRLPSYGAFFATAQPHYWFGIARTVEFPGVAMDVDRVFYQTVAKDNDAAQRLGYIRQVGSAGSAFEHAVPERLFIDPATCNAPGTPTPDPKKPDCPQGVSAVKALSIAAAQGQKIYTLNAKNAAYHTKLLGEMTLDADTKAEIQSALAAGKEVTTHQAEITVSGWKGAGYILLDPDTGAGAYKISGGASGGVLFMLGVLTGFLILEILITFGALTLTGPLAIGAAAILLGMIATMLIPYAVLIRKIYENASEDEKPCFWGGIGVGLSLLSAPGLAGELIRGIGLILGIGVASNSGVQCFSS